MKIKIPWTNKRIGIKVKGFDLESILAEKIAREYGLEEKAVKKMLKDYFRWLSKNEVVEVWDQRKQNEALSSFCSSIHVMVKHWLFECKCVKEETFDETFTEYLLKEALKNKLIN